MFTLIIKEYKNICSLKDSEVLLLTGKNDVQIWKHFLAEAVYCSWTMLWVWYITRKNIDTVSILVLHTVYRKISCKIGEVFQHFHHNDS